MPFPGEPFLKDGSACGSPEFVDHGEQADGPLGQRTVVILLGEQRNDSPRQPFRPPALSLHLGEDVGQIVKSLPGQGLQVVQGPLVQALGLGPGDVPDHVPEEVTPTIIRIQKNVLKFNTPNQQKNIICIQKQGFVYTRPFYDENSYLIKGLISYEFL